MNLLQKLIQGARKSAEKQRDDEIKRILKEMGYKPTDKFIKNHCNTFRNHKADGSCDITLKVDGLPVIIWNDKIDIETKDNKTIVTSVKPKRV